MLVQDKTPFWKRKPSIVKCHMLILAHLARADIPKSLRADYSAVMKKCPLFLEEIINIANFPRPPAVSAILLHAPWHERVIAVMCPLAAKGDFLAGLREEDSAQYYHTIQGT